MATRKQTPTRGSPPAPKTPLTHPVKTIHPKDAALVEQLRAICMALPEAGERLSHGEPRSKVDQANEHGHRRLYVLPQEGQLGGQDVQIGKSVTWASMASVRHR